jgi:ribosomal protein S21
MPITEAGRLKRRRKRYFREPPLTRKRDIADIDHNSYAAAPEALD